MAGFPVDARYCYVLGASGLLVAAQVASGNVLDFQIASDDLMGGSVQVMDAAFRVLETVDIGDEGFEEELFLAGLPCSREACRAVVQNGL